MRKFLGSVAALLFSTVLFAAPHHGPETVKIDAAAKKQPAVVFPHQKHAKVLKCDTCHHTNKGMTAEKEMKVAKCSTCHLDPKAGVPSMREMGMDKNPFHDLCIDCHKTEKKGPTVCKDCHKK